MLRLESLGLSQKDAQSSNKEYVELRGQLANPGSPGKMAVKTECSVCVCEYRGQHETTDLRRVYVKH